MVEPIIEHRVALRELPNVRTVVDVPRWHVVIQRPSHGASSGPRQGAPPGRQPTM
jgi:hypothetical protein